MLIQLFKRLVAKFSQQTAIVYDKLRISYQELDLIVEDLSRGLSTLGITQGNCIAVVLPNCPEFVFSFYAIAQLNATILPLNHLFKEEELSYCIEDSQVKAIVTDFKRLKICQSAIAKLDREIEIIVVDRVIPQTHFFYDLITKGKTALNNQLATGFGSNFIYQYSTGSTGKPKRVCRTQDNLYHEARNFAQTTHITAKDKILCTVPLYHAHGLGNCLLAATCNGATLVILEPVLQKDGTPAEVPFVFRRPRILELIKIEKITIFPGVPYIFNTIAETPAAQSVDLSSLRLCFSAGNFLSEEIFGKFLTRFNLPIRQLYGCTEAGSAAINLEVHPAQTRTSVGFPLKNVEIKIIDEAENELPDGMIGEIAIKTLSLTSGYANQPELNQQSFKNGCFLTGDIGKKDCDGRLYVTGRKKLLIDTGGRKVDSLEIEEILMKHPKIQEAVVVGVKGEYAGELIKAILVRKPQQPCKDSEIISFCKMQMAEFKVPRIIEFRPEIPKSALGKVLRKELV